ncbi:MAG: PA14 domain-containing protein, partial [Planctomycetota bacterium]
MCRKFICLISFVVVLGLVGEALAQPTGEILFEYWFNITGTAIANLTGNARYPNNPDDAEKRQNFQGNVNWRDNYGTRVRGYVYPPANGAYTFWISGDDYCQLFLSTDDDPAKKTMIAEVPGWTAASVWDKYPAQKSSPITLVAGKKYYIEALMKEGGGGDSLTVAWGGPTIGAGPVVIAGQYLSAIIRPSDYLAQAPTPASSFSLSFDFGAFVETSSARISQTDFALEIDADLGTAQFTTYQQSVDPLILPGGFNTGNIRVEVVPGSSRGDFDKLTGEFNTSELYAVHFDGDLSMFHLTSPVVLPSTSAGTVTLTALTGGSVIMAWAGTSQLPNPFDLSTFIPFRYTCAVQAAFAPEPVTLLELALIPNVINLDLPL